VNKIQGDIVIKTELLKITRGLKATVAHQAELGVDGFDSARMEEEGILENGTFTLADIRAQMGDCKLCELHKKRTQIIFGEGPEDAELMFVGEAPGRDEDIKGVPFVGRAGQLLTRIIKAMQYTREEVYITNVNKCRPPNNRDPKPEEVSACEPFLVQQIQVIKPKVIVALGRWAAQTLLKTTAPIGRLRGNFHDYHGISLMPTYHPAAILRNPHHKKPVWDDMQKVMELLGKVP